MGDVVLYGGAASLVVVMWVIGLMRLDVFTPDDVRALRRLAELRGYARSRSRLERAAGHLPLLARVQAELDLDGLLAISGRSDTAIAFLGRAAALSFVVFAALFSLDALGRATF